jgi:hypothetical protein
MLEAICPLFDIATVPEQTPVTLKGMPCDRLYIVKAGSVDVLSEGVPDPSARCAIGMWVPAACPWICVRARGPGPPLDVHLPCGG